MRLITRCPQCETSFRVIPDQLKLAQGWVRCGRCTRVFEAAGQVFEFNETPANPEVADVPAADVPMVGARQQVLHRPNRPWWMLALLLLLTLAGQWAFHARHVVAAQFTELRQPLQSACRWLGCDVSWPLDLQAVSLVSSAFEQREAGHYRLMLQWRNLNSYPVATPAVTLALTDAQDQVVVRKVLTPQMLDVPLFITPGALKTVVSDLNGLDPELAAVAGYRVMLFYP